MAIRTYKVTLDSKNSIAPEPVFLRQGDKTGAVVIDATLMDNGAPLSIDGLTPIFKANTADGQAVIDDSTGFNIVNASGGEFTYQVPNALSSVPGKITTAYFSLSDSYGSESTFDVAFIIKKAVDITQAQADDYITIIDGTLQSLQAKITKMGTDVQSIQAQIASSDIVSTLTFNTLSSKVIDLQKQLETLDKRKSNATPLDYIKAYPAQLAREVNNATDIGITQAMVPSGVALGVVLVDTDVPWSDNILGWPTQTAKFTQSSRPVALMRIGTSDTTWSDWELITTW